MMKHLRYALAILGLGRGYELVFRPENQTLCSRLTDLRGYISMFVISLIALLLNVEHDVLGSGWIIGLTIAAIFGLAGAIKRSRQTYKEFTHVYATSDRSNSLGLLASKWTLLKWRLSDSGRQGAGRFSWRFRFTFLDPNRSAMLRIDPHWNGNTRNKEQIRLAMKAKETAWDDHRENDSLFWFLTTGLIWCYKWRMVTIATVTTTTLAGVYLQSAAVFLAGICGCMALGVLVFAQNKLCDLILWSRNRYLERQAPQVDPIDKDRLNLELDARLSFRGTSHV